MMNINSKGELDKHNRTVLAAFIVRARRVEEHSLMEDVHRVIRLAQSQMTYQFTPETGEGHLIQEFPDKEMVESVGARIRPLILNGDPRLLGEGA